MSKKQQVVLLNIKNFGINLDLSSKDNLFKLVPFSNFKKLLGLLNSSQIIEFQSSGTGFREELYRAFNLKGKNFLKLENAKEKLDQLNEFLVTQDVSQLNNIAHVFLHLDNEFEINNAQILSLFLEKIQTFLDNQEYIDAKKFKFCLNLIVSRPLYDWSFFRDGIKKIQNNTDITIIINSIVSSKNLLNNNFNITIAEAYFGELFAKQHKRTFSSLNNLTLRIKSEDRISKIWVNENSVYHPFAKNDLVLTFSFKSKELDVLHALLVASSDKTHNFLFNIDKYAIKETIEDKEHFLEDLQLQNTVISAPIRDSFLFGLFPQSEIKDIIVQQEANDYEYVLKLANQSFISLVNALKERKTDIVTLNWNIFREVKEKFGPHLWLFSILVFDIYITKIVNLLNRKRIRWMLFSTSYGFERMFRVGENDKVATMYLTNKIYTPDEKMPLNATQFQELLAAFLTDEKIKNNVPIVRIGRALRVNHQFKKIRKIRNNDDLMAYLKKVYYLKYKNTEAAMARLVEFERTKNKLIIPKAISNLFEKKITLAHDEMFFSLYQLEKQLYDPSASTTSSDYFYFYKKAKNLQKYMEKNSKNFTESISKPNSMKKMFYNRYTNHLSKMYKIIENEESLNTLTSDSIFKQAFKKFQIELRNLRSIKYTHLNDLIENHNINLMEQKKKGIKLKSQNRAWQEMYSKVQDKQNQEFKSSFDLTKLTLNDQLQEQDLIVSLDQSNSKNKKIDKEIK